MTDTVELITLGTVKRPLLRHDYWHLVPALVRQQLRARYRQSSLQLAWSAITPAAFVGIYALFFHGILRIDGGDLPYLAFIVVGLVPWRLVATSLGGVSAINDNSFLIGKVYFPREIIPFVNVTAGLVDVAVGTVLMLVIAAAQGLPPTYHLVALPLVYVVIILFSLALTNIVSTVAVFARDLAHAMPLVVQGLFFATPIMYPASQIPSWLHWLVDWNPISVAVTAARDVVLRGRWPEWPLLGVHLVAAVAFFVLSIAYVRSVEHRIVDVA